MVQFMAERKDYSGEFDPDFRYEDLSKEALVRLAREYALIVHLLDRSVFTAIGLRYGQKAVEEIAIQEWAGASPIYTQRMKQIMNIDGDGVSAIFKCLQLDPGFPGHYMDVEYELISETHGFFQLRSCGALLDVEPFGERSIKGMCHTIEDGTFDVTAQAVNPKARIRPVHRPPQNLTERPNLLATGPHCRWEVTISDDTETLPEAEITTMTRGLTAATFQFPPMRDGTPHIPG
jgi:hypothetical protein